MRKRIMIHEPQYYTRLLLSRNSYATVLSTSVLVSEILIGIAILCVAIALVLNGASPGRQTVHRLGLGLFRLVPFLAALVVLSTLGAAAARWAETRRLSGRLFSTLPFYAIGGALFFLGLSFYLKRQAAVPPPVDINGEVLFVPEPFVLPEVMWLILAAAVAVTYTYWALWWRLFLNVLEKTGDVHIWEIVQAADTQPSERAGRYFDQHRRFMSLKLEALKEKKLRQARETDEAEPSDSDLVHSGNSPRQLKPILPLLLVLAVALIWRGSAYFLKPYVLSTPAPITPQPENSLEFWYSAGPLESSIIEEAITSYNADINEGPCIQAHNVPGLAEAVVKAGLSGKLPHVLLADAPLAGNSLQLARRNGLTAFSIPVWSQEPWRPDLHLVMSSDSSNKEACRQFADYLIKYITTKADNPQ